jgi:hypothetical protein
MFHSEEWMVGIGVGYCFEDGREAMEFTSKANKRPVHSDSAIGEYD